MTRPELLRADSIDLQDQNAPSAQDHTRQPVHPAPLGTGALAPHQADTLRVAALEAREENHRSPRVSKEWTTGEVQGLQQYGDDLAAGVSSKLSNNNSEQQDNLAVAQNGGHTGSTTEDAEMADAEGDEDDDMMDKISSSPSIDDGGYSLSQLWPQRCDSLERLPKATMESQACCASSSPFVETPEHFPMMRPPPEISDKDLVQFPSVGSIHYHLPGEYPDETGSESNYDLSRDDISPRRQDRSLPFVEDYADVYELDDDFDLDQLAEEILASDLDLQTEDEEIDHGSDSSDTKPSPKVLQSIESNAPEEGIATIPYESTDEGDEDDSDISYSADSRFIDSGWGGECLQELEDIDFEFVYALHTFVATVEGQANATKGDTMVLLDDSNSYWWLVRVVKDSSIGYLPAEHIETPTERLARLNKHRNIDLTSSMLGDQAEKSRNPLKIAIRRRNAKTVTFTAPTYVEASDMDYSTDEDEADGEFYGQNGQQEQNGNSQEQRIEEEEVTRVEPLNPRAEIREVKTDPAETETISGDTLVKTSSEGSRSSDEMFDGKVESKSRNGTVRNTDSFFRDDTVETKKITLTPNLLRDDSSTSTRTSNESKELKQRASLDKLEKDAPETKTKDKKEKKEKKEKEKKPGMLSGLFKRKEKKAKAIDDEIEELEAGKRSMSSEKGRLSPASSKDSEEVKVSSEQEPSPASSQALEAQKQSSKLQKQAPLDASPTRKPGSGTDARSSDSQPVLAAGPISVPAPSLRMVQSEAAEIQDPTRNVSPEQTRTAPEQTRSSPEQIRTIAPILTINKDHKSGGSISKVIRAASDARPIKTKKSKSRVELDDFDSTPEHSPVMEPTRTPKPQAVRPIPGSFPESYIGTPAQEKANTMDRLSESPVEVSPVNSHLPALMVDTFSQEDPPSPVSSPSPDLVDVEDAQEKKAGSSTTSASTPTWSDAHLRTFFDDDADIRDLLVVVYDKSGVVPAGPEHPITGNLFKEENAKLADITTRLDGMLGDWLARKMRTHSSR